MSEPRQQGCELTLTGRVSPTIEWIRERLVGQRFTNNQLKPSILMKALMHEEERHTPAIRHSLKTCYGCSPITYRRQNASRSMRLSSEEVSAHWYPEYIQSNVWCYNPEALRAPRRHRVYQQLSSRFRQNRLANLGHSSLLTTKRRSLLSSHYADELRMWVLEPRHNNPERLERR